MIAALYVQRDGVYYGLPDVDPWDEERDARLYAGPWPVVAHPPCARWCLMAGHAHQVNGAPPPGEDGGTFAHALESVRRFGGVLEHPAQTAAFAAHGLAHPCRGGWQATLCGGWVCEVEQGHYGHRARKPTWLYVHGLMPPVLPWGPAKCEDVPVEHLSSKVRHLTPIPFRDLLLDMARSAQCAAGGRMSWPRPRLVWPENRRQDLRTLYAKICRARELVLKTNRPHWYLHEGHWHATRPLWVRREEQER